MNCITKLYDFHDTITEIQELRRITIIAYIYLGGYRNTLLEHLEFEAQWLYARYSCEEARIMTSRLTISKIMEFMGSRICYTCYYAICEVKRVHDLSIGRTFKRNCGVVDLQQMAHIQDKTAASKPWHSDGPRIYNRGRGSW